MFRMGIILLALLVGGCGDKNNWEDKYTYREFIESFRFDCNTLYWGDKRDESVNWLKLQLDNRMPPTINKECIDTIIFVDPYKLRIRSGENIWILDFFGNEEEWIIKKIK